MDWFVFDDEYVRRLRDGDPVTEEHFSKYFTRMLAVQLLHRHFSMADAQDITQQTLFSVLKSVREDRIRHSESFGAYVVNTARHIAQEWWRRSQRTQPLDDDAVNVLPSSVNLLDELLKKENRERVRRVLRELGKDNPRDAKVLRALFIDDRDKDAVCRSFGITRDYLRVLVFRALKLFRGKYDDS